MWNLFLLYKHQCFTGISATEKSHIFSPVKIRVKISVNQKSFFVAMFSCLGMDNSSVYVINRIIHGRLEFILSCLDLICHSFDISVNSRR